MGIKVVYYISPQVWAWKKNRAHLIRKYVEKMLVIFDFEKAFYKNYGVDATFVGHPLIDMIPMDNTKDDFLKSLGIREYKGTVGLLPGSREKEIERILPVMIQAAVKLHISYPMMQFLLIKAPTISKELLDQYTQGNKLPLTIVENRAYRGIQACDLCMVASGTATLETAILQKPMVVIYKTSFLTWLLAKLFVKIPYIGLVNVVAGKKIVPEFVQQEANGIKIAEELDRIWSSEQRTLEIKEELRKVKKSLGSGGASHRAAEEILKVIA